MRETEAAVAIVHTRGPEESVLLMRRAEREGDSWSGHWSFPGGRRDPGDVDLLQTALRELEEECGVRLQPDELEARWPARYARRRVGAYIHVTPFFFGVDRELAVIPDEREAAEAVWIPLSLLRDPARSRLMPIPGVPETARFPAVPLNGGPLWGFTYRLICDWLEIGPAREGRRAAAFETARAALELLLEGGLELRREWRAAELQPGRYVNTAEVGGEIPVPAVFERFSQPGPYVQSLNCLEVGPSRIRIIGSDFEEYIIESCPEQHARSAARR